MFRSVNSYIQMRTRPLQPLRHTHKYKLKIEFEQAHSVFLFFQLDIWRYLRWRERRNITFEKSK